MKAESEELSPSRENRTISPSNTFAEGFSTEPLRKTCILVSLPTFIIDKRSHTFVVSFLPIGT